MPDTLTSAIMRALDLEPNAAETTKQQLAIEKALAEQREIQADGAKFAEGQVEQLLETLRQVHIDLGKQISLGDDPLAAHRERVGHIRGYIVRRTPGLFGDSLDPVPVGAPVTISSSGQADHTHEWKYDYHFHEASAFGEILSKCACGALRIKEKDGSVIVYIGEAEARLLAGIEREFAEERAAQARNSLTVELAQSDAEVKALRDYRDKLEDRLEEALLEGRKASEELGVVAARGEQLEEHAATLIGALLEYGESPWWLRAAHALDGLHYLAVEKGGH